MLDIWTNPGETGGGKEHDEIDNDGNGYIDDYRGWDFGSGDNNPTDELYPNYHGTHVAGIIGAVGNNDEGITGVCWAIKLMVLRIYAISDTIAAISYAANNGAKVINASWGESTFSQSLYDAINYARAKGVLFIASAGNDSKSNNMFPHYPSSYGLSNIISVLATDHNDDIAN